MATHRRRVALRVFLLLRRPTLALLLATVAASGVPGLATAQIQERTALVAALDSTARVHAENDGIAGLSVAVVRGADTLLHRGYGLVDLEWNVATPEDASASYEIGSVTKQFTAAAILLLVEEGKLDLDTDFTEYLPDFDARGHEVPLRRLLDHTSGIRGYTEMPVFGEIRMERLPRDTLVSLVEAEPFDFEPGTAQIYNNSAYFLLGMIIEEVSEQSYADFVAEHLFGPAGMDDSYYCSERQVRQGRAHGYDSGPDGLVRKAYLDHTWPYAAGSLCSTVGDLAAWNRALHGGGILRPESYELMTTPAPLRDGTELSYAMGLGVGERNGYRTLGHGGGINGFLADLAWVPEQGLTIAVLQNAAASPGPGTLTSAVLDLVLGPRSEPEAVPTSGDLEAFVGEYAGPARGVHLHLTVSRDGQQLVFTRRGQDEGMRPVHVGDGTWAAGGTRLHFVRSGERVLELRMSQGAGHYVLRRLP